MTNLDNWLEDIKSYMQAGRYQDALARCLDSIEAGAKGEVLDLLPQVLEKCPRALWSSPVQALYGTGDALAVSPDGKIAVAAGMDPVYEAYTIRDLETGEIRMHSTQGEHVEQIAFSPSGKRMAFLDAYGILNLYDPHNDSGPIRLAYDPEISGSVVSWSSDGKWIVGYSVCNYSRWWKLCVTSGEIEHCGMAFGTTEGKIYFLNKNKDLLAKDLATGETETLIINFKTIKDHEWLHEGMWASARSKKYLIFRYSNELFFLDLESKELKVFKKQAIQIKLSANDRWLAIGDYDNVDIYDLNAFDIKSPHMTFKKSNIDFAGDLLVTVMQDNSVARFWDLNTKQEHMRTIGHGASVEYAKFHNNDTQLISASRDGTARLWSVETGEELGNWNVDEEVLPERNRPSSSSIGKEKDWEKAEEVARIHPNGKYVLQNYHTEFGVGVQAIDTSSGSCLFLALGHMYHVNHVAFSSDGNLFATAPSEHFSLRLWRWPGMDEEDHKLLAELESLLKESVDKERVKKVIAKWRHECGREFYKPEDKRSGMTICPGSAYKGTEWEKYCSS